jgi:hypothetical protein
MKTFCPNCEKVTDSSFICEVYFCKECAEDNGNYEKPMYKKLRGIIEELINNSVDLASELKLEQNKGYECLELIRHKELMLKVMKETGRAYE